MNQLGTADAGLDNEFAHRFAREWVTAWNRHDLDEILTHYSEDFEMSSPVIRQLANEPSGTLQGKSAVRDYWARALAKFPELHFELLNIFVGAHSLVIHYRGHRGLAAEVFFFNAQGKVNRAYAHYE